MDEAKVSEKREGQWDKMTVPCGTASTLQRQCLRVRMTHGINPVGGDIALMDMLYIATMISGLKDQGSAVEHGIRGEGCGMRTALDLSPR